MGGPTSGPSQRTSSHMLFQLLDLFLAFWVCLLFVHYSLFLVYLHMHLPVCRPICLSVHQAYSGAPRARRGIRIIGTGSYELSTVVLGTNPRSSARAARSLQRLVTILMIHGCLLTYGFIALLDGGPEQKIVDAENNVQRSSVSLDVLKLLFFLPYKKYSFIEW